MTRTLRSALVSAAVLGALASSAAADDGHADAADDAARVGAALRYYGDLAEWQIRSEVDAAAYGAVRRSLGVIAALATGRPADALASAASGEPPLLRVRPVLAGLSSGFGDRRDPFRRRRTERHRGVDLAAERGTPVHVAGPGIVVRARRLGGYGRAVYVDHGEGVETRYAHLEAILVDEGDFVPAGAVVGRVGSSGHATGPHLHFEVRVNGVAIEPVALFGLLGIDTAERDRRRDDDEQRDRDRHHRRRTKHRDRELRSRRPAS